MKFYSTPSLLQSNLRQSLIEEFPGADGRPLRGFAGRDARWKTVQSHFAARVQKEGNAEATGAPFFARWINYTMRGALQFAIGQALQHITHVHHNVIWKGRHRDPFSFLVQYFQSIR